MKPLWEYKTELIPQSEWERRTSFLGAYSWELVHMVWNQGERELYEGKITLNIKEGTSGWQCFFKRDSSEQIS